MKSRKAIVFCGVLIALLIAALGSTAEIQKQPDCGKNTPWSNPGKNCNYKQKPYHYYERDIYLNREQRGCKEVILVCGAKMVRESTVARDPGCPEAFWPDTKDGDEVCCEEFQKAVKSKQPCDPSKDADCDGVANEKDPDPFKPSCDPCSDTNVPIDLACSQLREDVAKAYREAGASRDTAEAAGAQAIKDCAKKKCQAKNNPKPPGAPTVRVTCFSADQNTKCCELEVKVSKAYLNAGASVETALDAGNYALLECEKKNPKKQ